MPKNTSKPTRIIYEEIKCIIVNDSPKKKGIKGREAPKTGAPPSTKEATIVAKCSDLVIIVSCDFFFYEIFSPLLQFHFLFPPHLHQI